MSSNENSRSNSPAIPVSKSTGKSSPLRGILTSPTEPTTEIVPDLGAASSALFGLLTQSQPIRTLSPFPKPSLGSALEAARCAPQGQPRRAVPVQNRGQPNHKPAANSNPALISALASSAAKDAIAKYGQNTMPNKPSNSVAQGKGKNSKQKIKILSQRRNQLPVQLVRGLNEENSGETSVICCRRTARKNRQR